MTASVGTWAWARRTGGRMSRRDQLDQLVRGALARMRMRRAVPLARDVRPAERPPDTAFARAAYEAARESSSEALLAHCVRTWLWSDLVAQAERVRHDPELLYAASLLHDLGLTPDHFLRRTQCFAVDGAYAAQTSRSRTPTPGPTRSPTRSACTSTWPCRRRSAPRRTC